MSLPGKSTAVHAGSVLASAALRRAGLDSASVSGAVGESLPRRSAGGAEAWTLGDLAGRLVELSGHQAPAHLTAAFGLVLEAQLCGERAAWVTFEQSTFFPPDAAAGGVDVESLPVVRIGTALAAGRAAEHLVRSGGFGLVVIDLSSDAGGPRAERPPALPVPLLTRLLGLARTHHAAVLVLTRKPPEVASLNSLVSLRVEAQRCRRHGHDEVWLRALKDKRRAPGWEHVEACRGSVGMR